ncbi:MAG: nitroreductase family protein [Asticcacaulis sp.]
MTTTNRTADYPIQPQFLHRWSPRAFADKAVTETEVLTLLEAARWAPSASNLQPWRFVYGLRGTPEFDTLLSLLVPFNEGWAKQAGALIFMASVTSFDGERPVNTHSFDTGAAWMSLALQAQSMGLVAHGMAGIDYEKAPLILGFPDNLKLEAAVAIGYEGDSAALAEPLRSREAPAPRQALSEMAFKGHFTGEIKSPA